MGSSKRMRKKPRRLRKQKKNTDSRTTRKETNERFFADKEERNLKAFFFFCLLQFHVALSLSLSLKEEDNILSPGMGIATGCDRSKRKQPLNRRHVG